MDGGKGNLAEAAASDAIARYLQFVAHLDMPLGAKIEMISALQTVVGNIVDRAWGDDPVQHVHEIRASDEKRSRVVVGSKKANPHIDDAELSSAFNPFAADGEREDS